LATPPLPGGESSAGGEVSDRQWSDVAGIIAATAESLDVDYLRKWGSALGISDLLDRAMNPK